ncbi:hypothetical protein MMC07_008479 [Pseudocyphellaria aurata]|nr:hypothetical protein [Pseudocyphellaria aurata]
MLFPPERTGRRQPWKCHIQEMQWPGSGKNEIISESEFKQIIYDRGCSRGARGWKTVLSDEDLHQTKAKARKAQLSKTKVSRAPGEELDPNVIGRKELGFDKQMAQVAAHIAHGFKSELTVFYEETNTAKEAAEKILEKENQGEDPLHYLAWTATRVAQLEEEERTGKISAGRKPQYDV